MRREVWDPTIDFLTLLFSTERTCKANRIKSIRSVFSGVQWMFQPTLLTCTGQAHFCCVTRTLLLYSLPYIYLPALVTKPIVCELFLYPDINLIERHLLLGGGHGQAYQRRIGVGGLGAPIIREVHVLKIKFGSVDRFVPIFHFTCDNNLKCWQRFLTDVFCWICIFLLLEAIKNKINIEKSFLNHFRKLH